MTRTTTVLAPATAGALTTLANLKDELQITDGSADAYLTRRILAASSSMAAYCARTFGAETVADIFMLDTSPCTAPDSLRRAHPLVLSRDKLSRVLSVTTSAGIMDPSQYYADLGAGLLFSLYGGLNIMWTGYPVVVQFVSGWVLPGDPARTLPQVIEDVCIDTAAADWYARGRDPGLRNETVEGVGTIRYTDAPFVQDIRLDPFRVHV